MNSKCGFQLRPELVCSNQYELGSLQWFNAGNSASVAITIIKSIYGSCYYIIATVIAYLLFNVNCIFNIMFVLYPLLLLVYPM